MQEDVSNQLFLFVCCHGSRDKRCGVLGPPLCAALEQHVAKRGLQGRVHVRMCSHIGGHKVRPCSERARERFQEIWRERAWQFDTCTCAGACLHAAWNCAGLGSARPCADASSTMGCA